MNYEINNQIRTDIEDAFQKPLITAFQPVYSGVETMFTSQSGFSLKEIRQIDRILEKYNRKIISVGTTKMRNMYFYVEELE